MFRGMYRDRSVHDDDFLAMMERSRAVGMRAILVTAGSLEEVETALALCAEDRMISRPTHEATPIDARLHESMLKARGPMLVQDRCTRRLECIRHDATSSIEVAIQMRIWPSCWPSRELIVGQTPINESWRLESLVSVRSGPRMQWPLSSSMD